MINTLREMEDAYVELFSQKESSGGVDFFINSLVPEMYDLTFTLVKEPISQSDLRVFIENCLKNKKRDFLKIVFHPRIKLTYEFLPWVTQLGFEVSKISYMLMFAESYMNWIDDEPNCVIKQATTADEIKMGLECAIQDASQRMGLQLASKKSSQKENLYLNKSIQFNICYVDGRPIGFCDWFQKGGIVKFEEVVILEEYQGKGYGSKMLKKLITDAKRHGNQYFYVVTDTEGEEHNLYSKLGFKFIGEEMEILFRE